MTENFLSIPFYEGKYEVGDQGTVRSVARKCESIIRNRQLSGKVLRANPNEFGYMVVGLHSKGKSKTWKVHRLVLMAFGPNAKAAELDVNHINGVKSDNRLENLEWTTRSENHIHRYKVLGQKHSMTGKFGKAHHRSMGVIGTFPDGKVVCFESMMDAQRNGFQASQISSCISGVRKTHKGATWVKAPNLRGFV